MKPTKKELRIKLMLMEGALIYFKFKFPKEKYGICEVICLCSEIYITEEDCKYLHNRYNTKTYYKAWIAVRFVGKIFPELLKYKPDNDKQYWWSRSCKNIRVKVMTELINSYKEQLK